MGTMVIGRIEDQGDRILLHPKSDGKYHRIEYYVIADPKKAENLKVGDTIQYNDKDGGVNFGWFVSKK